jgi:hypothetical protein
MEVSDSPEPGGGEWRNSSDFRQEKDCVLLQNASAFFDFIVVISG